MQNQMKLTALCPQVFGISDKRYRQLGKEGKVPEPIRGNVDSLQASKALISYYRDRAEVGDRAEYLQQRARKMAAEADLKTLESKEKTGELMPRAQVINELIQRTYVIKADMLAIEKRLLRWPQAYEIIKNGHRHMMEKYSGKTGVFKRKK